MKLTNTLTKTKEVFEPRHPDQGVSLYTCGPTVYHYAHIGNLRSFTFYDTLRRTLELQWPVRHVMNITDVGHLTSDADEGEDKLEAGAKREGKTVWDVAAYYTTAFQKDAAKLKLLAPNTPQLGQYSRATSYIQDQIELVARLVERGFAYQTKQAIYFDVTKLADYGQLSGQKLADKATAVRSEVVTDTDKRHPADFAVWFFTVGHFATHEMRWDSPWGEGFPGWHLECSAIIHATLGDTIDIHTGGVDHIGTHHSNEIAQSEAAYGQPLARFWLHNEFLLVDGGKMSKSKGNFYTLADIQEHAFHPLALRLLFLQAHYRSQQNFTWEALEAAQNALLNIYALADMQFQPSGKQNPSLGKVWESASSNIKAAFVDDLHTERALSELAAVISGAEALGKLTSADARACRGFLSEVEPLFGLGLDQRTDIDNQQKQLIAARETARLKKDFAAADKLRAELADQGLDIDDTPSGPRWRRTTI